MARRVISVFCNYNKAQLAVGAFVLLHTPNAASALPHTSFSSQKLLQQSEVSEVQKQGIFCGQYLGRRKSESQSSHWERSKHLLNAYPVSGIFSFTYCMLFPWTLGTEWFIMLIGHLFLIHTFSKTSKMASIIPILQMWKLTCPMSPSQPWGSWDFSPGLTLLYTPNERGNQEVPHLPPFIAAGSSTSGAQRVLSKCLWTENSNEEDGKVKGTCRRRCRERRLKEQRE